MGQYFAVFFISILICAAGEWACRRSRTAGTFLCCLSAAFPVILAGARDYSVGTDIATYGNYVFRAACNARSLRACLRAQSEIDLLYKGLAYAVSRFTNNPHLFYLVTALIICGFTMAGLWYYRRWCSITLGWACFLFLFYGDTLNTMRQCLALAIAFAAFPFFLEKKYLLFAVFHAAAILFHATGILALVLPVIYLVMKKMPPCWLQFFLIIAFMGVILFYSPLLRIVLKMNLLPAKFARYMAKGVAVAVNPTILRLPFLLPVIFYYDRFCGFEEIAVEGAVTGGAQVTGAEDAEGEPETTGEGEFWKDRFGTQVLGMFVLIMLLLEICTVQLRSVRPALYRISYYFGYYRFIAYSRIVRILRRDNRALVTAVLIVYLMALWYYQNVIQGNNQIYPYVYAPEWFHRIIYVMPAE